MAIPVALPAAPKGELRKVEEKHAVVALIDECKGVIEENFQPADYNIGFTVGVAAGQTVMHCHCHVIQGYVGDVRDPRNGVQGMMPGKDIMLFLRYSFVVKLS